MPQPALSPSNPRPTTKPRRCGRQQCLRRQRHGFRRHQYHDQGCCDHRHKRQRSADNYIGCSGELCREWRGTVYTVAATDPDAGTTLTYSISGADAALFNIDAATGAVTFKSSPNYEAPGDAGGNNVYDVNVTASDGTNATTKAVAITVTNVNEAPTVTSAATANFAEKGGTVYTAAATDPDAAQR